MASMPEGSETADPDGVMLEPAEDASASDTQRWFTFLPFMEVHTHMQAAALRLHPGRKLAIPPRSAQLKHSTKIRTATTRDAPDSYKFDLAQVWKMHSPSSYTTPYGFRRALTGENQDSPTPELDVRKYPSLEILRFFDSDRRTVVKFRPLMSAEDILRFLLSDFARKGQCDELFEDPAHLEPASTTPRLPRWPEVLPAAEAGKSQQVKIEPVKTEAAKTEAVKAEPFKTEIVKAEPVKAEPGLAEQHPRAQSSPRSVFGSSCLARMREAEQHFATLAEIEDREGPARQRDYHKRRKLSIAVMRSISKTLFDANKVVLDATLART
jgi:hypothetical protein